MLIGTSSCAAVRISAVLQFFLQGKSTSRSYINLSACAVALAEMLYFAKSSTKDTLCRLDLVELQNVLLAQTSAPLSRNDIIFGITWCIRALVYKFALPGEVSNLDFQDFRPRVKSA